MIKYKGNYVKMTAGKICAIVDAKMVYSNIGKNRIKRFFFAALLLFILLFTGCNTKSTEALYPDELSVSGNIRDALKAHSHDITVRFTSGKDLSGEGAYLADKWITLALAESGDPKGGDYIRYQYGGYTVRADSKKVRGGYENTIVITPKYYLYLFEEERTDEKVKELMEAFGFDEGTSDAEKTAVIYDYICNNVRYDRVHEGNPYHTLRSTAYGALVTGCATCQGYCVSIYRLCREAGLDCRVITGTGHSSDGDTFHSWNIVKIDGKWYGLDATRDSELPEYEYFLKGSGDFKDHTPADEFLSEDFLKQYPMSEKNY